ncbi:LOW QUALITY PROTEIN: cytoplasmic dynein 2 heavy chain 1-like [Dermacentor silvarum]|uniref:LOW QUALITY PROTEIN: cytoplasmic dynein 2 heavy chain 1-like n=1 Tax=Dermacentor silvarum TaxID=543639 RepID=UPI0021010864|nr:LOW QUALITY PROTEIN: cytoplasmic dynein 2 heavy chain 1-like [Dermacentor silvarum]
MYRLEEAQEVVSLLNDGSDSWEKLVQNLNRARDEAREAAADRLDAWSRSAQQIATKTSLQEDEPALVLGAGGRPRVSLSPRLASIAAEARQLRALGCRLPPGPLRQLEETAARLGHRARHLQQVASFYSTVADQMIPSQRPLMLGLAEELTAALRQRVPWGDVVALDAFVGRLRALAARLAGRNRHLRAVHLALCRKVMSLFDLDLVCRQQNWKDVLNDIRATMAQQQESPEQVRPWRAHWDRQLYKALECQYLRGLETLLQYLPETRIELTCRSGQLCFRPPLEEVRSRYYQQVKRFLALPLHFRGVSDDLAVDQSLVFSVIVDRNAHQFVDLYRRTQRLFASVQASAGRFQEWVALSSLDLQTFAEGLSPEEWKNSFRTVKAKCQEFGKAFPDEERFECLVVSYAPVRSHVDFALSELESGLVRELRASVARDAAAVRSYLETSLEALAGSAQTAEELAQLGAAFGRTVSGRDQAATTHAAARDKQQLLARWSRRPPPADMDGLQQLWDTLDGRLHQHRDVVAHQMEVLKANASARLENFEQLRERFLARWEQARPRLGDEAANLLGELRAEMDALLDTRRRLASEAEQLGLSAPGDLATAEQELQDAEAAWALREQFRKELQELSQQQWILMRHVGRTAMGQESRLLEPKANVLTAKGQLHQLESFLAEWAQRAKDPATPPAVAASLYKEIDAHKAAMAVLPLCRGDAFSAQHWAELFQLAEATGRPLEELRLSHLLAIAPKLAAKKAQLQDLNSRARSEANIRAILSELDVWGSTARFSLVDHTDSAGNHVMIVQEWAQVLGKVGELQLLVHSLAEACRGGGSSAGLADGAALWEERLARLEPALRGLQRVQQQWLQLEPLLGPPRSLLPDQASRFEAASRQLRTLMAAVARDERIVLVGSTAETQALDTLADQLGRCQRALHQHMEDKRSRFPRFYFLGDEDLLEVLGNRPSAVEPHLRKLFAAVHRVEWGDDCVTAVLSPEGEKLVLSQPVKLTPEPEVWLGDLSQEIRSTLQALLRDSIASPGPDSSLYPAQQVVCLAEWIRFTEACEAALDSGRLAQLQDEVRSQLSLLAAAGAEMGSLHALLIDAIHRLAIVEELSARDVRSVKDWHWQKQLRFYLRDGRAVVKMVDATFDYTYEYQGSAPRLVYTALTHKCFVSLTQGMRLGVGGNPYGPAGTGKTESVKALGNALGRQVLVFNCDESMDERSLGRLLVGLARSGAWGCLDEFNRLDEGVLSAMAALIGDLQLALHHGRPHVRLLGVQVELDRSAGVFITLNPAGKQYGGRQRLPDSLKQLFRPVAMAEPDSADIARALLLAGGFEGSQLLAARLVTAFQLARELLVPQQHYDWGLRALKSVLLACGRMRLVATLPSDTGGRQAWEQSLVVQAVRLQVVPKLAERDCGHFERLLRDVFPGVLPAQDDAGEDELSSALREAYVHLGLTWDEAQVRKVLQLREQLSQRTGVMLVGPPGSGKTSVWRLLQRALHTASAGRKPPPRLWLLGPKAMPRQQTLMQVDTQTFIFRTQLLGYVHPDTREWCDGVLTASAREAAREPQEISCWIVCDGDVDPEWVESLNSVLDDNRLLTLPSGERIQFGPNVHFVFETDSLAAASPATVSRVGMVFLSAENSPVKGMVTSWLQGQSQEGAAVADFMEEHFFRALRFTLQMKDFVLETSATAVVRNALSYLRGVKTRPEFALALARGLSVSLGPSGRDKVAKEIFSWMNVSAPDPSRPLNCYWDKGAGRLVKYDPQSSREISLSELPATPVVETVDVCNAVDVLTPWLASQELVIIAGPDGCGKSVLLSHCLARLPAPCEVRWLSCTAQTGAAQVSRALRQACAPCAGGGLQPRGAAGWLVLCLRGLGAARRDRWGSCQLAAWLHQVRTHGGYHDPAEAGCPWVTLQRVQLVATVALPASALPPRLLSAARVFALGAPQPQELARICDAYLRPVTRHLAEGSLADEHEALAASMVTLVQQAQSRLPAAAERLTARLLTDWVRGLVRYSAPDAQGLLACWAHEGCRLFKDSLADDTDRAQLDALLAGVLRAHWPQHSSAILQRSNEVVYVSTPGDSSTKTAAWGSQLDKLDLKDWNDAVLKTVRECGAYAVPVHEWLSLVAQADWALGRPAGWILVGGASGMARRLAVRLAAHRARLPCVSPRGRSLAVSRSDLRPLVQSAGLEGQRAVLLLEDQQLDEDSLDLLAALWATGEAPGLFRPDELDLAPLLQEEEPEADGLAPWEHFCRRVRRNLHVALVLDASFIQRHAERHPWLRKGCSVHWLSSWSRDSFKQLPALVLDSSSVGSQSAPDAALFLQLHEACLSGGLAVGPSHYFTMVCAFRDVFAQQRADMDESKKHLQLGISKLNEAKEAVSKLEAEAAVQRKLLAEKQGEADAALQQITSSMTSTSEQKAEMEQLRATMRQESERLKERKQHIDRELAQIEPLVQNAQQAVGSIRSDALSEIRSLRAPPDVIRDILEGVLRLMGIFDTSWVSMKSFLAKKGVKEEIMSFNARSVTPEIKNSVQALLRTNGASFDMKNAKRASAAAAPLAAWVQANVQYADVLHKIGPLEAEQGELQRKLSGAEQRLGKLGSALAGVDERVSELRERLGACTREAARIEMGLRESDARLAAAQDLLAQLEGEHARWSRRLGALEAQPLAQRCLLASACAAYLGALPAAREEARSKLLHRWRRLLPELQQQGVPGELAQLLSSEKEQLAWRAQGLPPDRLSIENAALLLLPLPQRPFIIDPSGQASRWLQSHLKDPQLITQQDPTFLATLELSVRLGKALLVQDVQQLDPILYPLLRRDLITQGSRQVVHIADKAVDYSDEFRLFLLSQDAEATLPPYAATLVRTIDFSTTEAGLCDQLLQVALQEERPELEERRQALLHEADTLRLQLSDLDTRLLDLLLSGDFLHNQELRQALQYPRMSHCSSRMQWLQRGKSHGDERHHILTGRARTNAFPRFLPQEAKASGARAETSLAEAQRLQASLEKERAVYEPAARLGARLVGLLDPMARLGHTYRWGMAGLVDLFRRALRQQGTNGKKKDLKLVERTLIHLVYEHAARSLFKKDHLTFALHLIHGLRPDLFRENEWESLTGTLVKDTAQHIEQRPSWLIEDRSAALSQLKATLGPELWSALRLEEASLWQPFARSGHCEEQLPEHATRCLSPFQQALLVQCLRPDRALSALGRFACRALGLHGLNPGAVPLQRLLQDDGRPLLLVTAPGADPGQELRDAAQGRLQQVFLGRGAQQQQAAQDALRRYSQTNTWLWLANLHLATQWLPFLAQELARLERHPEFRLCLSTEPHPAIPSALLKACLTVVYEPPAGVRRSMRRTYDAWGPSALNGASLLCAQALFALAWLHAILQERLSYVPQGWTKRYEFSEADLRAGTDAVRRLCGRSGGGSGSGPGPWETLRGLFELSVYGSHLDNTFDRRVLGAYVRQCFDQSTLPGSDRKEPAPLAQGVRVPTSTSLQAHLQLIEKLPDEDPGGYLGLAANVEGSVQRLGALSLVAELRRLQVGAGGSRQAAGADQLAPLLSLWKSLHQGGVQAPPAGEGDEEEEDAVASFLRQERAHAAKLVHEVHSTLAAVSRALRHASCSLPEAASALTNHTVPDAWLSLWSGGRQWVPEAYLRAVAGRAHALAQWCFGQGQQLHLGQLLRPGAFLSAWRQQTARQTGLAVDELQLEAWWEAGEDRPPLWATLVGLQCEGGLLEDTRLRPCRPGAPSLLPVPPCSAAWMRKGTRKRSGGSVASLAVYTNTERQELVASLSVPCEGSPQQWLLSGTALFLSTLD